MQPTPNQRLGRYETSAAGSEAVRAFVPPPLPPDPPLRLDGIQLHLERANQALGRLGRLLITFLLCEAGVLQQPILYLSLHLKSHRQTYYDLLTRVRAEGTWEAWMKFFLDGVTETCGQAIESARRIMALLDEDRRRIEESGTGAATLLRVHQYAATRPILTIGRTAEALSIAFPTASSAITQLRRLGILSELTRRKRGRIFRYDRYLAILDEGTAPLGA